MIITVPVHNTMFGNFLILGLLLSWCLTPSSSAASGQQCSEKDIDCKFGPLLLPEMDLVLEPAGGQSVEDLRETDDPIQITTGQTISVTSTRYRGMGFDVNCLNIQGRNVKRMIVTGRFSGSIPAPPPATAVAHVQNPSLGSFRDVKFPDDVIPPSDADAIASGPIIKLIQLDLTFVPIKSRRRMFIRNLSFAGCVSTTRG